MPGADAGSRERGRSLVFFFIGARGVTYFLNGWRLGGGVLYKMLVTASSAVRERGRSMAGNGGGRILCEVL